MAWGGAGAAASGLQGEVGLNQWRAVFGPGGARHPLSGERLVSCLRPGLEIVVSPHKSVAELGVIGRAEDMHAIADAERDATMAYLDKVVQDQGGRRGRAQVRTPTGASPGRCPAMPRPGVATPRSTTTFLLANFVRMGDDKRWLERPRHRRCCVTTSTPPPPSGAWRRGQGGRAWLRHRGRPRALGAPGRLGHLRYPERSLGGPRHPLGPDRRRRRP